MQNRYQKTMYACFVGYVVQAVVNNFAPLLFLTFESTYEIPLSRITLLITINFMIQLLVDLLSAGVLKRIGCRAAVVAAHLFAAAGLLGLAFLPELLPDAFAGLLAAVTVYAVGGGLIEVLISPLVESCPTPNKEKAMSLLHSFYCWGHVAVVLLSTLYFRIAGIENWKLLTCIWALLPIANAALFATAPIAPLVEEGQREASWRELFRNRVFWILMLMMLCAGAAEQAVSQWASIFAEKGLRVGKTVGDIAGPMAFAILMGSARAFYGKFGEKIRLDRFMLGSSVLCAAAYLCISLSPSPFLSLIGCAVCGLSVGIMWPGSYSKAAASIRNGGTAMFALLALAGDMGCCAGPTLVGCVADLLGDDLKRGILVGIVFPIVLIAGIFLLKGEVHETA